MATNDAVRPVARYDLNIPGSLTPDYGMVADDDGEYIRYTDHASAIAHLQARVEALTGEVASERRLRLHTEGLCTAWMKRHDHALESLNEVIAERNKVKAQISAVKAVLSRWNDVIEDGETMGYSRDDIVIMHLMAMELAVAGAVATSSPITQPEADHG